VTGAPRAFLDQLIGRQGHLVHRIRAKDTTGRYALYFIYVRPNREAAFLACISGQGEIGLEDHGDVLASCYGDEPTAEVRGFLHERYGFDV